jgi:hypothetical protein
MNPDEDWPIISARLAVLDAEELGKAHPGPFAALDLQHKRKQWEKLSQLTVVKKNDDEEHS